MAIASPLFVEPVLQLLEPNWGPQDGLVVIVGFVVGVNLFFALGSFFAVSGQQQNFRLPIHA